MTSFAYFSPSFSPDSLTNCSFWDTPVVDESFLLKNRIPCSKDTHSTFDACVISDSHRANCAMLIRQPGGKELSLFSKYQSWNPTILKKKKREIPYRWTWIPAGFPPFPVLCEHFESFIDPWCNVANITVSPFFCATPYPFFYFIFFNPQRPDRKPASQREL